MKCRFFLIIVIVAIYLFVGTLYGYMESGIVDDISNRIDYSQKYSSDDVYEILGLYRCITENDGAQIHYVDYLEAEPFNIYIFDCCDWISNVNVCVIISYQSKKAFVILVEPRGTEFTIRNVINNMIQK